MEYTYTYKELIEELEEYIRTTDERLLDSPMEYKMWVLSKLKKGDRVDIDFINYSYRITTFKLLT